MSQVEQLKNKHKEDEDAELRGWFSSVDVDESGKITAEELRAALINGDWSPFDMESVKMLMTIYDKDRSGTIEFQEFAKLWKYVKHWQVGFDHFDKDKSGTIDGEELEKALRILGYDLNPKAITVLQRKYATSPDTKEGGSPVLNFDHFLRCCVAVETLSIAFKRLDPESEGSVNLDYDTFMYTFLSVP